MKIRTANLTDMPYWSKMRTSLWPDTEDKHLAEIKAFFNGTSIDIKQVYIVEHEYKIIGFMELNIRNFAEGSRKPQVPYVEAWYILPEYQGRGFGKKLMKTAEKWAIDRGYNELASDTETHNSSSVAIHHHLGFEETERIVCFLKKL